jgi:hypothetical protein
MPQDQTVNLPSDRVPEISASIDEPVVPTTGVEPVPAAPVPETTPISVAAMNAIQPQTVDDICAGLAFLADQARTTAAGIAVHGDARPAQSPARRNGNSANWRMYGTLGLGRGGDMGRRNPTLPGEGAAISTGPAASSLTEPREQLSPVGGLEEPNALLLFFPPLLSGASLLSYTGVGNMQ